MEIILTLSVLTIALIAFIFEWFPVDLTAIMVAIVLMLLGLVTPEEGIAGFWEHCYGNGDWQCLF